jgi:GDP-L-fucose synthase
MEKIELKGKTILVTGAAGFIGSNLVKRLLNDLQGATIVGIDNMNAYYDPSLKEYRLQELEKLANTNLTNLANNAVDNNSCNSCNSCSEEKSNSCSENREKVLSVLSKYGINDNRVVLWGTGKPLREFLWSEDMADASVHVLLNVNFSDIIGIEKYSSVHYGATTDGAVDRNHSAGRGGYIPSLGEIRNCHINVGTGKELTIRELSELVVKAVGFEGTVEFDASKPDGTMRKLIDVSKLHSLGWTHKVEIENGVQKLFEWYQDSLQ